MASHYFYLMSEIVSLREITQETLHAVLKLRVSLDQEPYVAPSSVSIAQAYYHPEAWFRAIYADDTPVGFLMLEDWSNVSGEMAGKPVLLWRFMIDRQFQRKGYGKAALCELVEHIRAGASLDHFLTSCVEGPHSPKPFYTKFGFVDTGDMLDGEAVLRYEL